MHTCGAWCPWPGSNRHKPLIWRWRDINPLLYLLSYRGMIVAIRPVFACSLGGERALLESITTSLLLAPFAVKSAKATQFVGSLHHTLQFAERRSLNIGWMWLISEVRRHCQREPHGYRAPGKKKGCRQ